MNKGIREEYDKGEGVDYTESTRSERLSKSVAKHLEFQKISSYLEPRERKAHRLVTISPFKSGEKVASLKGSGKQALSASLALKLSLNRK